MSAAYCPVCGCLPDPAYPAKHRWCAVALAYGWPGPLPVLPRRSEITPPPETVPCRHCDGPMPRLTKDGRRLRRYCSKACCAQHQAAEQAKAQQARLEDVHDLLDMGESPRAIAAHLGVTVSAISGTGKRHGDPEIQRLFEAARSFDRYPRRMVG